jgi:PKD domain
VQWRGGEGTTISKNVVTSGDVVTATLCCAYTDLNAAAGIIQWGPPGTVVSGCTGRDTTCTVRIGKVGDPRPRSWQWNQWNVYFSFFGRRVVNERFTDELVPVIGSQGTVIWAITPESVDPPPTAGFDVDRTGTPLTFQFTGRGTPSDGRTIKSYSWTFSDGTAADVQNPTKTFKGPAPYSATIKVTDDKNRSGSYSAEIGPSLDIYAPADEIGQLELPVKDTQTVTVGVVNSGATTITNVVPGMKKTIGAELFSIKSGPIPASIATLEPGERAQFVYEIEGIAGGDAGFVRTASGTSGAKLVTARPKARTFTVGNMRLKVTLKGKVVKANLFNVELEVTNDGTIPLKRVRAVGETSGIDVTPGPDASDVQLIAPVGVLSPTELAPGASTKLLFQFAVAKHGDAIFSTIVQAESEKGKSIQEQLFSTTKLNLRR